MVSTTPQDLSRCRQLFVAQGMKATTRRAFRTAIYRYFDQHGREFTWRSQISPYRVLVSEIMLQQTQTQRVAEKFTAFIQALPDFTQLAAAPQSEVLGLWKGLGYNRRALNLQRTAQLVVDVYGGELPSDPELLVKFPGIGKATAASICAFAFNQDRVFIETNIRTVFIHFFFPEAHEVDDKQLMPLIAATLDTGKARRWYYALMDYGVMIKKTIGNLNRQSRHYTKQSPFVGSHRQLRGMVLQALLASPRLTADQLAGHLGKEAELVDQVMDELIEEGFVWGGN